MRIKYTQGAKQFNTERNRFCRRILLLLTHFSADQPFLLSWVDIFNAYLTSAAKFPWRVSLILHETLVNREIGFIAETVNVCFHNRLKMSQTTYKVVQLKLKKKKTSQTIIQDDSKLLDICRHFPTWFRSLPTDLYHV